MRTVRIANGQGFWGDNVDEPLRLLEGGPIDYLGMDYLAEVTLSIMMRQKLKNPAAGYATDFLDFARRALPLLVAKGVKVVTNAGGLNPRACRERVFEIARSLGLSGLKVGVVEGDDLLARLPALVAAGHELKNMDSGAPLAPLLAQHDKHEQPHADHNAAIGHVEDRPAPRIQKIHHVAETHAINDVAQRPTQLQAERQTDQPAPRRNLPVVVEDDRRHNHGDDQEHRATLREQPEGRARVVYVGEAEDLLQGAHRCP